MSSYHIFVSINAYEASVLEAIELLPGKHRDVRSLGECYERPLAGEYKSKLRSVYIGSRVKAIYG